MTLNTNKTPTAINSPSASAKHPLADRIMHSIMPKTELDYLGHINQNTVRALHRAAAKRIVKVVDDATGALRQGVDIALADAAKASVQQLENNSQLILRLVREGPSEYGLLRTKRQMEDNKGQLDQAEALLQARLDQLPDLGELERKATASLNRATHLLGSLWVRLHLPVARGIMVRRARRAAAIALAERLSQTHARLKRAVHSAGLEIIKRMREQIVGAIDRLDIAVRGLTDQRDEAGAAIIQMSTEQRPFLGSLLPGQELNEIAEDILRYRLDGMVATVGARLLAGESGQLGELLGGECAAAVDSSGKAPADLTQYLQSGRVNLSRLLGSLKILAAPLTIVDPLAVPGQARHRLLVLAIPGGAQNPLAATISNLVATQGTVMRLLDNRCDNRISLLSFEKFLSAAQVKPLMDAERDVAGLMQPDKLQSKAVLFDPATIAADRPLQTYDLQRAERCLALATALELVDYNNKGGGYAIKDAALASQIPGLSIGGFIAAGFNAAALRLAAEERMICAMTVIVARQRATVGENKAIELIRHAIRNSANLAPKSQRDRFVQALQTTLGDGLEHGHAPFPGETRAVSENTHAENGHASGKTNGNGSGNLKPASPIRR